MVVVRRGDLIFWVWVCGFGLMGLGLWIIDLTGVDCQLDWHGSQIIVVVVGIVVVGGRRWVGLLG